MNHFSNKLIVKDPFEMPAVDDTTVLVLRECANLVPHCWIWNESVGYLEVTDYKGFDIEVTVKNIGRIENAKEGTVFPSCMEFIITAPDSLPMYDTTVTCLTADFRSPEVGETGMMVVEDTSNIRVDDILIIDRKYRYTVTEILDEHTLVVLNEGDGKEGIIDIRCNECISVKILESTACCKVVREDLQAEIDDINDRLNTKKDIKAWNGNNLVTISGGDDALTDAQFDCTIKVDDDLSKYDNSVSQFITDADVPRGDLTVTSTNNVLTINSGSGTNALLKNANINLDLSGYAETGDIPTVNNGTLTIQKNGTTVATFTANSANNVTANITVPTIPSVPSTYSSSTSNYQTHSVTVKLESSKNDGSADSKDASITGGFNTVSLSSSGVSGTVTLFGNVSLTVEGIYNSDTHTYKFGDEAGNSSNHLVFVTARGPNIQITANPKINGSSIFTQPISSGYNYYCGLDSVNAPNGSPTGPARSFSIQLNIPIIYETSGNTTHSLTLDLKVYGSNLRKVHSGTGGALVNEAIDLTVQTVTAHTTLGWVIK